MGTMLLTMSCLGSNLIISSAFLTQMANTTLSLAFGFYAAVCFVSWVSVIFGYPDVKGMTLEDIQEIFQHSFRAQYGRELQSESKCSDDTARVNVGAAEQGCVGSWGYT